MARDYANIGFVLANTINCETAAIISLSHGLKMLEEFEETTGYHHPHSDEIQGYISQLEEVRDDDNKIE